jgi:hypothetical protein
MRVRARAGLRSTAVVAVACLLLACAFGAAARQSQTRLWTVLLNGAAIVCVLLAFASRH